MSSFYGNGGYSSGGGGGGDVSSVNGKRGAVVLTAADVHALPEDTLIPSLDGFATEEWVNNQDFLTDENTYLIKIIKEFQVDLNGSNVWTYGDSEEIHEVTGFWDIYYDTNYYINKYASKAGLTQPEIAERIFNQIGQKIPVIELTFKAPYSEGTQTVILYYDCLEKYLSYGVMIFVGPYMSGGTLIDFAHDSTSIVLSSDGSIGNGPSFNLSYVELAIDSGLDYYMHLSSTEKTTILEQMDQEEQDYLSTRLENYVRVMKEAFVNSIIPVLTKVNGAQKIYFWPIRNFGRNYNYNRFQFIGRVYESYGEQSRGASASTLYKWVDYIITIDQTDISLEVIDTLPSGGTEGQVLIIDANGNPKWDNTSFVKVTDDGAGNVSMETLYGVLVDSTPTQNSNNLVTSGGIYNAINAVNDIFFITATYDNNENAFVINKTFAEINTAISNGKIPVLIAEGQAWYWLYDKAPTYLRFICIGGNNTNNYIHIQSNGNVTFSTISSANPTNYYTKTEIDTQIGNIETLLAQI